MNTKDYLADYYEQYDEDNRLTSKHGQIEYRTTMEYIQKYLNPGMKILEIGAGTGRYSHALARQGYSVDAIELIEHNIEIFRKNTSEGEPVTVTQGNATDLSALADNSYDLTLLLGPMYHLFTEEEKIAALSEAIRVTKRSGIVFVSYCMEDPSIIGYGFLRGGIHALIEKSMIDTETFHTVSNPWDLFELYRKEEIDNLRGNFPVTPLHFVAADGFTKYIQNAIDEMDGKTYDLWLKYHLAVCERPELIGYSHHTIDIFRKD